MAKQLHLCFAAPEVEDAANCGVAFAAVKLPQEWLAQVKLWRYAEVGLGDATRMRRRKRGENPFGKQKTMEKPYETLEKRTENHRNPEETIENLAKLHKTVGDTHFRCILEASKRAI